MAGNMSANALWKSGLAAACLLSAASANATLAPALGGQVVNDSDLNITLRAADESVIHDRALFFARRLRC